MEKEEKIAEVFTLMETTARVGRELVTKIFASKNEIHKNKVNFTQFQILEAIVKNPDITQGNLCTKLFKNQMYISKCLKIFEKYKYIKHRFINNDGKTSTGYSITERGLIVYRIGVATLDELEKKIIANLKEDDVEKTTFYLNNLEKIITNIIKTSNLNPLKIEEDGEEET